MINYGTGMKTKIFLILSLTIAMVVLISCNNSTETEKSIEPYMSLQIGDMWQIYDVEDGYYSQEEVTDTTRRNDGLKVFICKKTIAAREGIFSGLVYKFIRDNYCVQTKLDSVVDLHRNIFEENKIAKIFPKTGDSFWQIDCAEDSVNYYMSITIIDSLKTPCFTFKNVAQYQQKSAITSAELYIYYAPDYGYIGSSIIREGKKSDYFVTYKKYNGKELGTYKSLPENGIILTN
jgi:hypothetical protein